MTAARRLDLAIPPDALGARLAAHVVALSDERPGWWRFYRELVQPSSRGAALGARGPAGGQR